MSYLARGTSRTSLSRLHCPRYGGGYLVPREGLEVQYVLLALRLKWSSCAYRFIRALYRCRGPGSLASSVSQTGSSPSS